MLIECIDIEYRGKGVTVRGPLDAHEEIDKVFYPGNSGNFPGLEGSGIPAIRVRYFPGWPVIEFTTKDPDIYRVLYSKNGDVAGSRVRMPADFPEELRDAFKGECATLDIGDRLTLGRVGRAPVILRRRVI